MKTKLLSRRRKGLRMKVWAIFRSHRNDPRTKSENHEPATVNCYFCNKKLRKKEFTVDHLVARIFGGSNEIENLVPSCSSCNQLKSQTENPCSPKYKQTFAPVVQYVESIIGNNEVTVSSPSGAPL